MMWATQEHHRDRQRGENGKLNSVRNLHPHLWSGRIIGQLGGEVNVPRAVNRVWASFAAAFARLMALSIDTRAGQAHNRGVRAA